MDTGFDVIGDIHGFARELESLLSVLGFDEIDGEWQNKHNRKVIFVGDLIDKGPNSRDVVRMARSLCEQGLGLCIMGNHEYNALCFHHHDVTGRPLRSNIKKSNRIQHQATLDSHEGFEEQFYSDLNWFLTLPLFLEFEGLRVIHAYWDNDAINRFLEYYGDNRINTVSRLREMAQTGTWQYQFVEEVLKGVEIDLPYGTAFKDKYGKSRSKVRLNWWRRGKTYGEITEARNLRSEDLVGGSLHELNLKETLESEDKFYLSADPLVIFGHYWQSAKDLSLKSNSLCIDFSIADDKLADADRFLGAYRWYGEKEVIRENIVTVPLSLS